eukprot:g24268.t1
MVLEGGLGFRALGTAVRQHTGLSCVFIWRDSVAGCMCTLQSEFAAKLNAQAEAWLGLICVHVLAPENNYCITHVLTISTTLNPAQIERETPNPKPVTGSTSPPDVIGAARYCASIVPVPLRIMDILPPAQC